MTHPLPIPTCVVDGLAIPAVSDEALTIASRYVTCEPVPGGVRIAYRPPGTAPEGPDLLYRVVRAHEVAATAEHLTRLLAPLVDVAMAREWAKHSRPTCGPDGPGDALDHRHEPPRLGGEVADTFEEDDGEVG